MKRRLLLVSTTLVVTATLARAQTQVRPSEVLYVHGAAMTAHHVLTPADLAQQPADMMGSFAQARGTPGSETWTIVRGVVLAPLNERLGLKPAARADWKNLLVTVTATDGYRAQFTWPELVNTTAGEGVLLLFERDGRPLDEREGRVALLSSRDFRLGARHVRNALRVEVRQLSD